VKVSLLITTYNYPGALELVLRSVARQTRVPDEVIICDDGSSIKSSAVAGSWVGRLPIRHTWQPDRGFRAARSRNLGISASGSEYLIFIDGDCLLPPNFVSNHLRLASPEVIVTGGRHLLGRSHSRSLLDGSEVVETAFRHWKFQSPPLGFMRDIHATNWKAVRTCNLSLYREIAEAIGGFDEAYTGWGREDSDLVVRLIRWGFKVRSARFAASVAHLHHPERSRTELSANERRFCSCLEDSFHLLSSKSVLTDS